MCFFLFFVKKYHFLLLWPYLLRKSNPLNFQEDVGSALVMVERKRTTSTHGLYNYYLVGIYVGRESEDGERKRQERYWQQLQWAFYTFKDYPTNNALLINFRLSSVAEILLISIQISAKCAKTCMQCVHIHIFQLCLHLQLSNIGGWIATYFETCLANECDGSESWKSQRYFALALGNVKAGLPGHS